MSGDADTYYEGAVEAILFASGEAVEISRIAEALGVAEELARIILLGLMRKHEVQGSGFEIIEIDGKFQMRTNPKYYRYVRALMKLPEKRELTGVLLETLAIIAYLQPVTKSKIEEIRGFSADHAVNRLIELGLAAEKGRLDAPGRPVLLGTTEEFLRRFGLVNLSELPKMKAEAGEKENTSL